MHILYKFRVYFLALGLISTGKLFSNSDIYHFEDCHKQATTESLLNMLRITEITYDGNILAVNSAFINDLGTNNFSNNHYEYFITLSDGVYMGNNQFAGGTYTINIELLSLGSSFNYGNFQSCFFCDQTTTFSYVGHLFVIEDTNNDDIIDFNTDPFTDGSNTGFVNITQTNGITTLEIDFVMDDGKQLKGCHVGEFPIDPNTLSIQELSPLKLSILNVYSNPAKEVIKFELENVPNKVYGFQIYNGDGVLVMDRVTKDSYQEIDIRGWSSGIYFLQVLNRNNKKIGVKKILVR